MKKTLFVLMILGGLLSFELAASEHASGSHNMEGHQMMNDHDITSMQKEIRGSMHTFLAGQPGDPDEVNQTIEVSMDDNMRFTPDQINVRAGDTVRFFVKNNGKLAHEMVIGTGEELKEHSETMREMPGMQHAEPNMIRLNPGQRGSLIWQFDKSGKVDFACLVPGHYEAGMFGSVDIQGDSR